MTTQIHAAPPTPIIELRALRGEGSYGESRVGHYDDEQCFHRYAEQLNAERWNIYSPINVLVPEMANGHLNHPPCKGDAARNHLIARRTRLPIDIDARRSGKRPATEAERAAAREVADKVYERLYQLGVRPLFVDSGNGFQEIVSIDLPNDSAAEALVKRYLTALSATYSNDEVKIDVLYDAARIMRVPGYVNWKSVPVGEQGRRARLISIADGTLQRAALEAETLALEQALLAAQHPITPLPYSQPAGPTDYQKVAYQRKLVERLLRGAGGTPSPWLPASGEHLCKMLVDGSLCPNSPQHTEADAKTTFAVLINPDGTIGARCHHDHCHDVGWRHVRLDWEGRAQAGDHSNDGEQDGSAARIRHFAEIPDLLSMDIPPIEWLVDGLIARRTLTLWTGCDGTAKTLLAQKMGLAVAAGCSFLGRHCLAAPVLYLDYENPSFAVRERLELLSGAEKLNPNFKVWGTWLEQQPPPIGSETLYQLAKEVRPLMIVDPFRYAHTAEENDSTEMMMVMQALRSYAAIGAAVVVLHHPAKTEGSTGRGSSAIRGAVDVAFLQEMSEETDLITLKCVKNRFGERLTVTIKPDFDEGTFEVTDSPAFTKRQQELERLRQVIAENPGLSKTKIWGRSGGQRNRIFKLLKDYEGTFWEAKTDGQSFRYFPTDNRYQENGTGAGTGVPVGGPGTGTPVPSLIEGTGTYRVPPNPTTGTTSFPSKVPNQFKATVCPAPETNDGWEDA